MEQILYILPRGLAIGALISAPMGPIGMLVIQRTLGKGRWPAFFTGAGAALSDLAYCLLTGFCLSFITGFIDSHQFAIQIIGSIVLAIFGIYLFRKNPTRSLKRAEVNAAIGLFARFNFIQPEYAIHHYIVAYAAIFCGAILWWYGVTALVGHLGKRINMRSLKLINRIIGFILAAMAVVGVCMAIIEHL